MINCLIYRAFDRSNGKSYVGQTTQGLESRLYQHVWGREHDHFHCALRVRPEAFVWETLEVASFADEDAAIKWSNEREIFWGEKHGALHPKGYSLCLGGRGWMVVSKATRTKIVRSANARWAKPEERQKARQKSIEQFSDPAARAVVAAAKVRYFTTPGACAKNAAAQLLYWKEHPEEKARARSTTLRQFKSQEARDAHAIKMGAKPFVCVETGVLWVNCAECARVMGLRREHIRDALNGKSRRKAVGGFHFVFIPANP